MPESIPDFARRIKTKYPEYSDVDDTELVNKIVAKYPEYREKISFDAPKPAAPLPDFVKPPKINPVDSISTAPLQEGSATALQRMEEPEAAAMLKAGQGAVKAVGRGAANTAGFVASVANAGAGMALGRPWSEVKAQWQRVSEMGEKAPLEEISNTLGIATMIYGGYEGMKAVPALYNLARNSNLVRKITIPERGLSTVPDEQVFAFYKTAPEDVKLEMAKYNPQLRNILTDPAKVERFSNAAPRAAAAAPEVPAAMAAAAPIAEPPAMPRPAHNSFEGTVLEFKIKQAIGLKPADALTPDKMAVAYEVGALPQELAEQAGLPAALNFAAQERAAATAKAAGPGAAQVPSADVVAQVVARKQAESMAAQKEAISTPHPEMGKPAYAMSEAEFSQALRKANPEASGEDISKAYEQVMGAAQDHKLVDGVELARMNDSALQAEADMALAEPTAFDMTEPASGTAAPLSAMTLEEARAKFPNLSEAQHKSMVKDAVDAYQVMPDEVPKGYEDVRSYATEKHANEQRAAFAQDEVQRQLQEQGHATPILNMLGRNKLNAKKAESYFGGEIHKDDMRGYLSTTGGLSVDEAAERAWSNGWIPDNDVDQFTEALQAEVRKKNVIADEGAAGEVLGRMGAVPEERPGYLETPGDYAPGEKLIFKQPAWHGSPHDFDKFSLHAIGTGEGAQAYGYGLYFAGDKAVAEYYRGKLIPEKFRDNAVINEIADDHLKAAGGDKEKALQSLEELLGQSWSDKKRVKKAIQVVKTGKPLKIPAGKLYEVEIPDSDKMLDWDRPLKEQPESVKKALMGVEGISDMVADVKGSILYGFLTDRAEGMKGPFKKDFITGGAEERVSKYLHSLGIDGIRYADGVSRKGNNLKIVEKNGKFTVDLLNIDEVFNTREEAQAFVDKEQAGVKHNYVIFDDNAVKILNKYYADSLPYQFGHVYQPADLLPSEADAMVFGAAAQAITDTRKVAPIGQWHDLRQDPAIERINKQVMEQGFASAIGQKIDTIQDAAEIAAFVRHPRLEHFAVVKLKDGKVTGSLVLTSGKVGYVDPSADEIQAFVADADEFYATHNHPTGNATPSPEDIASTKAMASDKRFKGHVVTDHQTYTAIMPDGTAVAQEFKNEKVSFRKDIEKMAHAPAVVGWARGVLQGDKLGIMFVDAQKQVMSFDQVNPLSNYNLYIKRRAAEYGSTGVFLVAGESAAAKMAPRQLAGNYHDFLVLAGDGSYRSARLGYVKGFNVAGDARAAEGQFSATGFAETPADYNPEDYNKVTGRWKPGMKLTLRARLTVPQFPKGLPKGTEAALVDVDVKTGELLADFGGKLLVVTPNMFKETFRVPGSPQPGQKERQFIDTVRGMEKTAKEVKDTIAGNYDTISNEVTLEEAKAAIARDPEKARRMVYETGEPTRLSNTVAMLFIDDLQKQGRFGEAVDLIEHTAKRNTSAGQAIQALAMYRRLTPEGILRYAEKVVSKGQAGLEGFVSQLKGLTDEAARVAFAKKHGLPYLSAAKADELYDAAVAVAKMPEGRERDLATGKMLQQVADLLPKGFWDKVSGLQILAQLLNPKTFIRNIIGNAAFMAFENFSQASGVPLDLLVGTMSGRRTTAMPGFMTQARGFAHGLKEGTEEALAGVDIKAINNKFDLPRGFTFDSTLMRALEKTLNVSLKATDRAFYQAAVEDSLRVAMKAGRVEAPTPEMVAQAHLDGLYRTFNDENALRAALVRTKRAFNFGKGWGMGDMVIKYPGTPASILMRGIEYSPFGFMQATYTLAKAAARGNFDEAAQREFVRQSSRAMTGGIGLVGAGVILSALGLITGRSDDKRAVRETEAAIGVRDYQFNVSGLLRFAASGMDPDAAKMRAGDMLVSYDWLQPAAIGLAMGANIEKGLEKSGTVELSEAIQSGVKTLTEQPLLQGIRRFFMGGDIVKGTVQSVKDIPASFIPTLLNQVKQLADNTSRTVQDNDALDAMSKQIRNKIPLASGGLAPRVDVLGRVRQMYQNNTNNPFNVFLNPAFVTRYQPTPTAELVLDIWSRSGETIQLPRIAPKQLRVRGVDRPLTEMEQALFQHYIGERTSLVFNGLTQNAEFMALPDHAKAKELQGILTDIYQSARVNVLGVPPK